MTLSHAIRRLRPLVLLTTLLLAGCAREPQWKRHAPTTRLETLRITFLDVGQGDAALLQWGDYAGLIDGGPQSAGPRIRKLLRDRDITHLDWVIATHPHSDHIGGLVDVFRAMPVDRYLDTGYDSGSPVQRQLLREVERRRDTHITLVKADQTLDLGGGLAMLVMAPSEPFLEGTESDVNNNSLFGRLMYGKVRVLFASDMEREGQRALYSHLPLSSEGPKALRADVLKVAHHGSSDATDARLLSMVRPRYAVVSCERRNDYGYPHARPLRDLRQARATLYRTDVNGDVTLTTDGDNVALEPARGQKNVWTPGAREGGS